MKPDLLERETHITQLREALDRVTSSEDGCLALIYGQAGIGKSSLVRAFLDTLDPSVRILMGSCDDLQTARTLGPFRDMARHATGPLKQILESSPEPDRVFEGVFEELSGAMHPAVVVLEDVHWADDATLDVLRFVIRRLDRLQVLVVLTYREEDVGEDHPLRRVLGGVGSASVVRLELPPLSRSAVTRLAAGGGVDPDTLYHVTGGNPFFVYEVLAAGHDPVPATIRDAVLARVAGLSRRARDALDQFAVIPAAVEQWLARVLLHDDLSAVAEAEEHGVIEVNAAGIRFRHELARRAILQGLSTTKVLALNRLVLNALVAHSDADLSRIVHHANQAHDGEAIVRYGPATAREAANARAHREARAHYENLLAYKDRFDTAERAALQEGYAVECYVTGRSVEAVQAQLAALADRRELGDPIALGHNLRWLSRMFWWDGKRVEAERAAREAVDELKSVSSPELAMAYSNRSQLAMLAYHNEEAIEWGEMAITLARNLGDDGTLTHALANVGAARWHAGDHDLGPTLMEEGLQVALRSGHDEHACRAWVVWVSALLDTHLYDEARARLDQAVSFAEEHEQLGFLSYLVGTRARLLLETGSFDDAESDARWVLSQPAQTGISFVPALYVLGRVQSRRGHPEAETTLREAWQLAQQSQELQRMGPVSVALAELWWLRGNSGMVAETIDPTLAKARLIAPTRLRAELEYWRWKAHPSFRDAGDDHPYALQMAGMWRDAADMWRERGCPYEVAMALAESDEPESLLEALTIADGLDAAAFSRIVRRQLKDRGVARIPRGPSSATRTNPFGLTDRQVEVLRLLADGLTNPEIASRLVVSARTVDHHVSAILARLDVSTRHAAVARAEGLGILNEIDAQT